MAIIYCPECGSGISEKAPFCPQCGVVQEAVTIQQTAKRWKAMQLLGAVGFGLFWVLAYRWIEPTAPPLFFAFAMIGFGGLLFYGCLMAWWHHG